ncbi:collagen-binding A-like protein [Lacticaseibacillus paracasei]|nr:collagen-binding A-like protein [Lacticaseibacillus paracasei]
MKASDNWKYSFTNLPEFENGKKITYTVTEDAVAGYTSTVDGYNVTNNHTPAHRQGILGTTKDGWNG